MNKQERKGGTVPLLLSATGHGQFHSPLLLQHPSRCVEAVFCFFFVRVFCLPVWRRIIWCFCFVHSLPMAQNTKQTVS